MAYRKYSGGYFRASVVLVDVVVEKILKKIPRYDLYSFVSSFGCFKKKGLPQIIHFNKVFQLKNHPFWGTPILGNLHLAVS